MCGIVGVIGREPAAPLLLDALKRLEYRGYDSAGVATLDGTGKLQRRRASGKLRELERRVAAEPPEGVTGIGHTRWATHGPPTERNAHPHVAGGIAVVHNGIIENYREIRERLIEAGVTLESDTDTELVAHLMARHRAAGEGIEEAFFRTLGELEGAYALAVLVEGEPDLLLAARRGSPLALAEAEGALFVGSDAIALAPFSDRLVYLEDGDWAVLRRGRGIAIRDRQGRSVARRIAHAPALVSLAEKGNYRHFMAKEIHEQPFVLSHTLSHYLDATTTQLRPEIVEGLDFKNVSRISLAACGTAYYAGLVGRYWFERLAGLPVDIDVASEFRYRALPRGEDELALVISQSGETADTLACLRHFRQRGQTTAAIVNVPTSTIAREVEVALPTLAGPEIGVASTKAFTCQLAALAALALKAGRDRGQLSAQDEQFFVSALMEVPRYVADVLLLEPEIERITRIVAGARDALYLGRGTAFPIALEGALKLKEVSYIHAEGYAAGELKHGPIALIDEDMPVIVLAPYDDLFQKTRSNMEEVAARGGRIILVTDPRGREAAGDEVAHVITLPDAPAFIAPILYAVPMQLIAYHAALLNGTDVDQPRNLAKSVTVE